MVILGKLLHSVSINPVLSTIKQLRWFIVCQEVAMTSAMMPDIGKLSTIWIAQANEKESNRKYLLKFAQIVWYLARVGWPLWEDGNEISGQQFCPAFTSSWNSWSTDRADTAA